MMRRMILAAAISLGFSSLCLYGDIPEYELEAVKAGDDYFAIFIEQDGLFEEIIDYYAGIRLGPFTFIIVMKEPIGVLVNFSAESDLYYGFRKEKPLKSIIEHPGMFMGLAEDSFNLEGKIYIDPVTPHYLFYDGDDSHRFSTVERWSGLYICKRRVEHFAYLDEIDTVLPIEAFDGEYLYVSALYSEYDANWNIIEHQKEAVKIKLF